MRKVLAIAALCLGLNAIAQTGKLDFQYRKGFTGNEVGLGYSFNLGSPRNELTLGMKYRWNPETNRMGTYSPTFTSLNTRQRFGMYLEYRHYFDKLGNSHFRPFVYGDLRFTQSAFGNRYFSSVFDPQTQSYDRNKLIIQNFYYSRMAFNIEQGIGVGFSAKINNKLDFYNKVGYSRNSTILFNSGNGSNLSTQGYFNYQFGLKYTLGK